MSFSGAWSTTSKRTKLFWFLCPVNVNVRKVGPCSGLTVTAGTAIFEMDSCLEYTLKFQIAHFHIVCMCKSYFCIHKFIFIKVMKSLDCISMTTV